MNAIFSISNTIQNEVSHWYGTLVRSASSPAYSFLQNVPYLSEVAHHTEISKKEPRLTFVPPELDAHSTATSANPPDSSPTSSAPHSRTNSGTAMLPWHHEAHILQDDHTLLDEYLPPRRVRFQILSDDVIYLVLQYLDCRSLLNVSLISSWYYHMTHEDIFWEKWLHIEESRVSYLQQQRNEHNDLSTSADYSYVEPRQLQLLHTFYKPSKEEEVYARFQSFSIINATTTLDTTSMSPDELSELGADDTASAVGASPDDAPTLSIHDLQMSMHATNQDTPHNSHEPYYSPEPTEQELLTQHYEQLYSSYLNFRRLKLRNPFIRSKLIRIYTHDLKKRYEVLTKWINHGKLTAAIALTLGTVSLSLQLDQIIEWWWALVFLPLMVFAILSSTLSIMLWMPTIQWPISLYRWVAKEYVGWWTSWAYSMSKRARWIQLFFGVWMPCTIFVAFSHLSFPSLIPKWAIFAWMGIGFLVWGFTPTQLLDPRTRKSYSIILLLMDMCLVFFCVLVVLKLAVVDQLFQPFPLVDFYWTIPFVSLFCALGLYLILELKLSFDLNRFGNARMPCACICWNSLFLVVYSLVVLFVVMLWVKLEMTYTRAIPVLVRSGMGKFHYFYIFIPLELVECMAIVYYVLRCYTNRIEQSVLKFPFQIAGGKWTNAGHLGNEYETFVV